jgi:hypothetical protein
MSIRPVYALYRLVLLAFFIVSIIDAGAAGIDINSIKSVEFVTDHFLAEYSPISYAGNSYTSEKPDQSHLSDRIPTAIIDRNFHHHWNAGNSRSETFDAVPEPATMILLGAGMILLAGLGRRKFLGGNGIK